MGSPIANLLMGQAAPSSALSGLSPEAQAALQALNGPGGVPAAGPEPAPTPAATPAPGQPPAAQPDQNMIAKFLTGLMEYFSPKTADLVPKGQPTPAPPTAEGLAQRNQGVAGGR